MATITPKPIRQGILLPNAAATTPGQYVVPGGTTTTLRSLRLCNTDTVQRVVTVHVVASGDTPAAKNTILKNVPLEAGETLIDDSLMNLDTGDFISAFADAANVVAMRIDGAEIT